ncbi:hypothetical protein C8Q80DRAFT_1202588 [Daedaleopsis nitida]|nr:hypothetical protein C8Q80DRAFT_1202588 [Daedaleopsis nitida]
MLLMSHHGKCLCLSYLFASLRQAGVLAASVCVVVKLGMDDSRDIIYVSRRLQVQRFGKDAGTMASG